MHRPRRRQRTDRGQDRRDPSRAGELARTIPTSGKEATGGWTLPFRGDQRMSRRLVNLTLDTLEDLPRPCRRCVYWELDPVAAERACAAGDPELEKEAWVSQTLLEWGSCGKLVYVDGLPAGFVMFAPPAYVRRSAAFPT